MDWRNVHTSFLERRIYLMETGMWTDCVFKIGQHGEEFRGHKLLLSMASPVFELRLDTDSPIVFSELDPDAFQKILEFIYTDRVILSNYVQAYQLHLASTTLKMLNVENLCIVKIKEFVSPTSACHLLEYSQSVECEELKNIALTVITEKTLEVLSVPGFTNIQPATLEIILRNDDLHVNSEMDLINAFMQWARENIPEPLETQALREIAGSAFGQLRFLTLTPQQLAVGPANTLLLTERECLTLFKLVSQNGPTRIPIPPGLSTCRRPRRQPHPWN